MTTENILAVKVSKTDKSITVSINYFYPELRRNRTEEITDVPHQDFNAALLNLSQYIARIYQAETHLENYQATGFKYQRDNHVILTGKMVSETGSIVGIATPQIDLDEDNYGFESDLRDDLNTLSLESLLLLNGSKVGVKQLTIEDSIEQNEESEKNEQELNDELIEPEEDSEQDDKFVNSYLDETTIKDVPENEEFTFNNKV